MRDVQQDLNLAEEFLPEPRCRKKISCSPKNFCHAQLAFQHHIEEIRRIAVAKDYLPSSRSEPQFPSKDTRAETR